jgi:hypothetical protein
MKNLNTPLLAMLVLCSALFTACESENEPTIIGKWNYASWNMAGQDVNLKGLGNPVIEFKEGGVYVVKAGLQENTENWTLDGDTLVFLQKNGESQKHLIRKLTADTMDLKSFTGRIETELLLVRATE